MRLLVLGGSVFLSRAVADDAVRRGHDVTCANRGTSGSVPDGARLVVWDRAEPAPAELSDDFDAVVDVGRYPSWIRSAVGAFPSAHWVFVSTVNVYPDPHPAGGTPATLALHEPLHDDVDLGSSADAYGRMKVACEDIVRAGAASSTVIRPGLIVGPGRPERAVRLLARAPRRRRPLAGRRRPGQRPAGDRRPRPRGLDRHVRRVPAAR